MSPQRPKVCKILLGEDCRVSSTLIRSYLAKKGYAIAGVGETGLQTALLYDRHRPDVVLLDVNMPEGNGLTILRLIREINPDALVIMLSNDSSSFTKEISMKLGAASYISKGTSPQRILEAIQELTGVGPRM